MHCVMFHALAFPFDVRLKKMRSRTGHLLERRWAPFYITRLLQRYIRLKSTISLSEFLTEFFNLQAIYHSARHLQRA